MYKEIGLLKNNQKPKINFRCGVLYIIKALNSDSSVYKIGKHQICHKDLQVIIQVMQIILFLNLLYQSKT